MWPWNMKKSIASGEQNAGGRVITNGFSGRLASDNRKFRENSSFPDSLKEFSLNLSHQTKVAYASWQLLSADEESLAVIQIGNTKCVLFLFFYWHVLSPHLILPVKLASFLSRLTKSANKPLQEC